MKDIIFIAGGIVALSISPFLFTVLAYPLYKASGGKGNILDYLAALYR